ncbi:RNA exonuclease 4-like isoform X1 [Cryptomeria japonica]|uniref:RNA exonuclease 4-like isoform X1 n=1 Tax=Cryptomeria japonica TaxID=3369 RepID=UPI0027DA6DB3|nr:RNA exonuclease 4-like isoform X1 [Cryptomeria japonica]
MDRAQESTESLRHKCAACFRQFNKVEHLVEHMKISYHSPHEPICAICKKHCRFYDSLREHLIGPLPKAKCAKQFSERGCRLCLKVFPTTEQLIYHRAACQFSSVNKRIPAEKEQISAIALDCEMVGGGQDGSLDLCARVCLVNEEEKVLFHYYVKPPIPITNYRYDITGIKPEHLMEAMPLKQVQETIQQILYNGEAIWRIRLKGGKAKVLVGHGLDHDLQCLAMEYPTHLIRDTAKYIPLLKTSKASNSLKYLTQSFLGYKIQNGTRDPYEDCVASMRIYKKMRNQDHYQSACLSATKFVSENAVYSRMKQKDLEKMSPEALLHISQSDFYCWCIDSRSQPT